MLVWLKRTAMLMCVGAVFGFTVWCLIGKGMTSMLFGSLGGTFSCKADVEIGLDKFVSMQLYSAVAGALLVFAGVSVFELRRKPKAAKAGAGATGSAKVDL